MHQKNDGEANRVAFRKSFAYDPPLRFTIPPDTLNAGARTAWRLNLPFPPNGSEQDEAFFYRLPSERVVGYFNRCGHVSVPLDFDDGQFYDTADLFICRIHGARYDPETGEACMGPAYHGLTRLIVEEDAHDLVIRGWEKVA